jgi:hypothetical protein
MAGIHNRENHQIAIKLSQELFRKIEIKAAERGMTPGQYIRFELGEMLRTVKLSQLDLEIIAKRLLNGTTFKNKKGAK